ncbi:MAG: creatininase family protein [Rhizobacter sp.]|nr:creatininase family protein [Rhizobacter sp.]
MLKSKGARDACALWVPWGKAMRAGLMACALLVGLQLAGLREAHAATATPYLEDMTSVELRARIDAGATTVLVPIGGTEQNGAHMALGKHNVRAHLLAGRIAERLGDAVVAPVLAYVPEGRIAPPQAHMRYTGTISISDATFEALLESIARSLRQHGFRDIVFLGDHGGYQQDMVRVANKLNRDWAQHGDAARAHALRAYYAASQAEYAAMLEARGFGADEIGVHAGLADTALTLALDPALVREAQLGPEAPKPGSGTVGDPRRATAALGQLGVDHIVDASVQAIRALRGAR